MLYCALFEAIFFFRYGKYSVRVRGGQGHDPPAQPQGVQPCLDLRHEQPSAAA